MTEEFFITLIGLFFRFVGKLRPILARLPQSFADASLAGRAERESRRGTLISQLQADISGAEQAAFDLDEITDGGLEEPDRPPTLYDLAALDALLRRTDLLPPGVEVKSLGHREYELSMPGMAAPLRATTSLDYFDDHPGSAELWSPGSPLFPTVDSVASIQEKEHAFITLSRQVMPVMPLYDLLPYHGIVSPNLLGFPHVSQYS